MNILITGGSQENPRTLVERPSGRVGPGDHRIDAAGKSSGVPVGGHRIEGLARRGAQGQGAQGQALGHTEHGIFRDRENTGDNRKAHHQAHH